MKNLLNKLEKSKPIVIDGKYYKELYNVEYKIKYNKEILDLFIPHHQDDDLIERNYLLKRLDECIEILKQDVHSRRAVFANLYDNNLCKCISLVQVFIRNKKIYINLYWRSQNVTINESYDRITSHLLMKKLITNLKLKPGIVTCFVMSLHKLEEN
jgi:thymidylate synthase